MYERILHFLLDSFMSQLRDFAPCGEPVTDYDRKHLALYAALLDAEEAELAWEQMVITILGRDPRIPGAEACLRSHIERARWITGAGLKFALSSFSSQPR